MTLATFLIGWVTGVACGAILCFACFAAARHDCGTRRREAEAIASLDRVERALGGRVDSEGQQQ